MFFNANALMGTKLKKFERLNKEGSLTAMSRKVREAAQRNNYSHSISAFNIK